MAYEAWIKAARKKPLFVPGAAAQRVNWGRGEIEHMLPHRAPFLFLDRISLIDVEQQAICGHFKIDPHDAVLGGHFPGDPVYPGVLLLEMMAQVCLCLQQAPVRVRLLRVHHALFLDAVRPGDELMVLGRAIDEAGYTAVFAGQVLRGEAVCAVAVQEAYFFEGG